MTERPGRAPTATRGRRAFQWLSLFAVIAIPTAAVLWLALPRETSACTPPATQTLPPSPITGVVIAVDSAGLGQVRGFTLRDPGGDAYDLQVGPLENAAEFSPSHLSEHMASSEPIRAFYRLENGTPTVYRLEDASG